MKCLECSKEFVPQRWGMKYCSSKCRRKHGACKMESWRREDRKSNPDKYAIKNRKTGLKRNYKMTIEDYDAMVVKQMGLCPVCGESLPLIEKENGKHPPVDHNHVTGKPRGILHNKCNRVLGLLNDDPERCRKAADYLERHG